MWSLIIILLLLSSFMHSVCCKVFFPRWQSVFVGSDNTCSSHRVGVHPRVSCCREGTTCRLEQDSSRSNRCFRLSFSVPEVVAVDPHCSLLDRFRPSKWNRSRPHHVTWKVNSKENYKLVNSMFENRIGLIKLFLKTSFWIKIFKSESQGVYPKHLEHCLLGKRLPSLRTVEK